MKQRIRPLLLFKKRNAFFQRISQNTYALANRQTAVPGGGEVIPDGSIIDPDTSYNIVDPDDGTTYIIEA